MDEQVKLTCIGDAETHCRLLRNSAAKAMDNLRAAMDGNDSWNLLYQIKFNQIGCDPLCAKKPLNLIETVNQTFTYYASFKAAKLLFQWHNGLSALTLNLGTKGGSDIESDECGGIAAEVFAAVNPSNNGKLRKDIAKVAAATAQHKYAFFICPGYGEMRCKEKEERGVIVYSLGAE